MTRDADDLGIASGSTTGSKTVVLSPPSHDHCNKLRADSARQDTDHVKDAEDRTETLHQAMCRLRCWT